MSDFLTGIAAGIAGDIALRAADSHLGIADLFFGDDAPRGTRRGPSFTFQTFKLRGDYAVALSAGTVKEYNRLCDWAHYFEQNTYDMNALFNVFEHHKAEGRRKTGRGALKNLFTGKAVKKAEAAVIREGELGLLKVHDWTRQRLGVIGGAIGKYAATVSLGEEQTDDFEIAGYKFSGNVREGSARLNVIFAAKSKIVDRAAYLLENHAMIAAKRLAAQKPAPAP